MITTISNHLIDWLIREDTLQPADRELYVYAAYCFLFAWTPLFLLFIISACIGRLPEALLLILPFMTIRKFSGGFHAKTARTCLIIPVHCCLALCIWQFIFQLVWHCILYWHWHSISLMTQQSHRVHLSVRQHLMSRNIFGMFVIAAMILYNSIILLLSCTGFSHWAVCLALGLILSAALQIPCIISKMKTS